MASDDEDVDLQALRSAVLASLKSKAKHIERPKPKDEEELENLRQAALQSKKVETQELLPNSRPFQKFHGRRHPVRYLNHLRPNSKYSWTPVVSSNLITIQTLPLDSESNGFPQKFSPTGFSQKFSPAGFSQKFSPAGFPQKFSPAGFSQKFSPAGFPQKFSAAERFHRPFHPQHPQPHNRILVPQDEKSSSPKVKQKSNDKFSRFESDSDSEDDSELNFPLNSSDSDDNASSTTADENRTDAGTTTVDVSEVDDHSMTQDGSLGFQSSDKENEDSHSLLSDKETVPLGGDGSLLNTKSESAVDGTDADNDQKLAIPGNEGDAVNNCESTSSTCKNNLVDLSVLCKKDSGTVETKLSDDTIKHQENVITAAESENTNGANTNQEEKFSQRQNGANRASPPSAALCSDINREKLEARRRKFESQPIIQPKNTKISLRDIVQSVQESEVDSIAPVAEQAISPQTTPHSSPRVARDIFSDSDSKGSDSSEGRQCKRLQMTRPKLALPNADSSSIPSKLSHRIALADTEQDLRVSLRLKRQERLQQRVLHNSGSDWSTDDSSSDHCSSPVIKSVLSVVKVESRDSDRLRESSPSLRLQRTVKDDEAFSRRRMQTAIPESRHDKNRRSRTKRRESRRPGWISSKRLEDAVNKDGRSEDPSSSTTHKHPVRMRLGLPVTASSVVNVEKKEAKKRRSESPSETFSTVESKIRRQSNKSNWQKDRSSRSNRKSGQREARVVRVAKKFSSTDSLESTGKDALAYDGDLDQKIRRIQEKNEAIMRRQEEVNADRKKYC